MYAISYRKRGFGFILFPVLLLIIAIGGYFLINHLLSRDTESEVIDIRARLLLLDLLLGIFSVFLCVFLVPLGMVLMFKKPVILKDLPPEYNALSDKKIAYIHDFSWGAFFGCFLWALGNQLYQYSWQYLIPGWNVYIWIKLFIDGRKLAWENGQWKRFRHFYHRQWILTIVLMLLYGGVFYWISTHYSLEMVENKFGINIMDLLEIK